MSMTWVMPARATAAMFSADQMPPPSAIRPVTHVMSIPALPCPARAAPAGPAKHGRDARVLVCRSSAAGNRAGAGRHKMDFILGDPMLWIFLRPLPAQFPATPLLPTPDDVKAFSPAIPRLENRHPPPPDEGRPFRTDT